MAARFDRTNQKILAAGALASILVFSALAGVAAEGRFFDIDRSVQSLAHRAQNHAVTLGMHAISILGDPTGMIPLIGLVSVLGWRLRRRYALVVPMIMIGAWALQLAGKWAIHRPRPNLAPLGFPSGHMLSLVVLLGLGCYLLVAARARRRWRYLAVAVCSTVLLVVAASRVYLEAHWLSDVVGGFAVGLAYLLAVIVVLEAWRPAAAIAQEVSEQTALPAA